ncbi:hypothetical protein B0H14DRAFT_2620573 [Mycena olivaceomarginata]|nr:hypothetical protein B0H14DRAFT_2620573 [Mycena olivaceomarginata]
MGIPNANNRSWDIPHHYGNDHMYHIRKACILSVGIPTCNVGIPSQKWEHPRHTWERDWECPHFIYMWAFPVVTWAFPVATGNAHITHVPTGNAHVTTGMRLGMPTHTIYVGDGNDHPYYVWKCHGPSHFLYGNDHSYHVWKLGMTILAIYGSGVVLPIPSVGNGHYCHIWKVWKAWVAQLELLSVELVNLSQQSSWLLDYPLDPAVQQKWSPFAREYTGGAMDCSLIPPSGMCFPSLETHSKQMAMTVTTFILYPFVSPVTLLAVPCQLHCQPSGFIVQVTGTVFHSLAESLLSTTQQMKYNSINESSQSPPKHPHYSLARKVGISNRCKSIHPRLLPIVGEPVNNFGRRQVEMVYMQDHGRIRGVGSIFAEATQSLLLKQAMAKWTERTKD